jgi:hypothetical protein
MSFPHIKSPTRTPPASLPSIPSAHYLSCSGAPSLKYRRHGQYSAPLKWTSDIDLRSFDIYKQKHNRPLPCSPELMGVAAVGCVESGFDEGISKYSAGTKSSSLLGAPATATRCKTYEISITMRQQNEHTNRPGARGTSIIGGGA